MKTAKFIGLLTTAAIGLSLAACGTEKTAADTALSEITLVLDWTPNTNHTGIYAADALGYYKDAGLKVNIVQPPEDGAVAMTASGKAQFGIDFQDYLAPAFASEEKMPVTAVAAILQHNTSGIISLKSAGIESPAGLEGKRYATWGLPVEQAMIKYCMEKDGADFSKLELVPEDVMDVPTALQQGIDAVWVYYAWDGISTEKAGLDTNMFFFKDIVPEFDYYSPVIIANDKFLADEPDKAKAFLAATAKGYEYAIENPKEAAGLLCSAVPELDADMAAASQEWISAQYTADADRWGYIDPTRWNAFYTWLYENGLYDKIEENTGFTNEYLPE
ncbi:MAG: ABC transporter substrate-binding protein [Clostridia bacterium]|nr:ABC transporter substrate-binding protein [Clostridia bacterium]